MDDKRMGRPIEFDENRVVENAMQAFWAQGVQAMTVAEMLAATGLARSSFYNSYGSKEALVVKAIERYSEMDLAALKAVLAGPSLRSIVDRLLTSVIDDNHRGRGCLLLNTAIEDSARQAAIGRAVRNGIARKLQAIAERVEQAQLDGEVDVAAEPVHVAASVCTMLAGLRTFKKAGLPREWLHGAARQTADALFPPPATRPVQARTRLERRR